MPQHTEQDRLRKLLEDAIADDERRERESKSRSEMLQNAIEEDRQRTKPAPAPAPMPTAQPATEAQFRAAAAQGRRGAIPVAPPVSPAEPPVSPAEPPGLINQFASFLVGESGREIARRGEILGRRLVQPSIGLAREGRLTPTEEVFRNLPQRLQQPSQGPGGTLGRTLANLVSGTGTEAPFTEEELNNPWIQAVAAVPPGTPIAPLAGALLRSTLLRTGVGQRLLTRGAPPAIAPPVQQGRGLPRPTRLPTTRAARAGDAPVPQVGDEVVWLQLKDDGTTFTESGTVIREGMQGVEGLQSPHYTVRIERTGAEAALGANIKNLRVGRVRLKTDPRPLTDDPVADFHQSRAYDVARARDAPAPAATQQRFFERVVPPTTAEGRPRFSVPESTPQLTLQEFKQPKVIRGLLDRLMKREGGQRLNAAQLTSMRSFLNRFGASPFETSVGAEPALGRFVVSPSSGERVFILGAYNDQAGARFFVTFNPAKKTFALDAQLGEEVSVALGRPGRATLEEVEAFQGQAEKLFGRELRGREIGVLPETPVGQLESRELVRPTVPSIEGEGTLIRAQRAGAEEVGQFVKPARPEQIPIPPSPQAARAATVPERAAIATERAAITRPGVGPATARVLEQISFKESKLSIVERFRSGLRGLDNAVFDDLNPIARFVAEAERGGLELSAAENPYIWSRLLKGVGGKSNTFIDTGTFGKQIWRIENGQAVPNFTGPGLRQVLAPVDEGLPFELFSAHLVDRRVIELDAKGIVSGIKRADAAKSIVELQRTHPEFDQIARQVYAYQDRLLQYGQESGLFSPAMVARLRQYRNYVPFHRVLEGMETKGLLGRKLANVASPIKKITGSERPIISPLESVIKNTHVIIDSADRNQVGVMMARLAEESPELRPLFRAVRTPTSKEATVTAKELGISIEGLAEADAELLVDAFRPMTYAKNANEVTVLINGEKRFFEVDPDLYRGLLALDKQDLGMFGKFFGAPARWLRAGAVLAPDFMVKNPQRDQLTAFVYSRYGFLPAVDWIRGIWQILGRPTPRGRQGGDLYALWRMSGGEMANLVSVDRTISGRTVDQIVKANGFTGRIVKNPIEMLRVASEFAENGTRVGEFAKGIRMGDDPLAVAFASREVSQDFSKMGTVTRAINQIIPFFGANVGGWSRLATEAKTRPFHAVTKAFLGITLPSLLLYSLNRNDPRYADTPQWQKDLFWIIPNAGPRIRIPKPFMLGQVFGSMPERFLEFVDTRDPELFTESLRNTIQQGTPGFLPQAALPFIENMTNHSFFLDRPIIPRDREDAPSQLQYSGTTSEAAKALGKLANVSPAQLDNIFYGYTGTLGRNLIEAIDPVLKATGITPNIPDPSRELSDIPVLRSLVVRDPSGSSSKSVNRFYKKLQEFEGMEKVYREHLALGQQQAANDFKDKNPEAGLFYDSEYRTYYSSAARALRRVARQMSEVRSKQRKVFNSRTMTPAEKRVAINSLNSKLTAHARQALDKLKGILEAGLFYDSEYRTYYP